MSTHWRFLAVVALLAMAACSPAPISREETPAGRPEAPAPADRGLQEVVVTGSRSRASESFLNAPTSYVTAQSLRTAPYVVLPQDREIYGQIDPNPIQRAAENPVSTFSVDVDTGAYSNVRRMLNEGRLPPQDAVRVEEPINYFDYG